MAFPTTHAHSLAIRLSSRLVQAQPGDVVTYGEISGIIGRDVQRARHIFYSAARIAEKETGAVFANHSGRGYRRLNVNELPTVGRKARAKGRTIHRHANRSITAGVQGVNDIDPEVLKRIYGEMACLKLLQQIGQDRNVPHVNPARSRTTSVAEACRVFLGLVNSSKPNPLRITP